MKNSFPDNMLDNGYTLTAIALHWTSAMLIASSIMLGLYMTGLALSPHKLRLYSYHKWLGVTVFTLSLLRIAWRVFHAAPALPPGMPSWERMAAKTAHTALYALIIVVPLSGWLMSSAHGFQTVYLGVLPLPDAVGKDKEAAKMLELVHFALNKTLIAVIIVHMAAAVKHHFMDKDAVLLRMLGYRGPRA